MGGTARITKSHLNPQVKAVARNCMEIRKDSDLSPTTVVRKHSSRREEDEMM